MLVSPDVNEHKRHGISALLTFGGGAAAFLAEEPAHGTGSAMASCNAEKSEVPQY